MPPASGLTTTRFGQIFLLQIFIHHRRRVEVIHRDVEKSLDLLRVQIHRENPVRARRHEQIRHELRRDRNARLIFAVLPG